MLSVLLFAGATLPPPNKHPAPAPASICRLSTLSPCLTVLPSLCILRESAPSCCDHAQVYEAWYNRAPYCPQLYLYSDADPLAPAAEVERYMKIQVGCS